MKRWDLHALSPSSRKLRAREPGADAPRVRSAGRQIPRVLFSSPECRAVVLDLRAGEELGDHRVRERAVVEVVSGRVSIESSGETAECESGALVTFDPGEQHTVRALTDSRLLLLLAPWPAAKHYTDAEMSHAQHLPANATAADAMHPSDTSADAGAGRAGAGALPIPPRPPSSATRWPRLSAARFAYGLVGDLRPASKAGA